MNDIRSRQRFWFLWGWSMGPTLLWMGLFPLWIWEGWAGRFAKPASFRKRLVFEPWCMNGQAEKHCWRPVTSGTPALTLYKWPIGESWEKILPTFNRAFSEYLTAIFGRTHVFHFASATGELKLKSWPPLTIQWQLKARSLHGKHTQNSFSFPTSISFSSDFLLHSFCILKHVCNNQPCRILSAVIRVFFFFFNWDDICQRKLNHFEVYGSVAFLVHSRHCATTTSI